MTNSKPTRHTEFISLFWDSKDGIALRPPSCTIAKEITKWILNTFERFLQTTSYCYYFNQKEFFFLRFQNGSPFLNKTHFKGN